MKSIGIFYGSTTGVCGSLAKELASKLGVSPDNIHDVSSAKAEMTASYEVLFLGASTWGSGDLQDDWYDFLDALKQVDLKGKVVCLFGCGDSAMYSDTFCDSIGILYEGLNGTGCTFAGNQVDTSDYIFDSSAAVINGCFVGLALDDNNEPNKHSPRIDKWLASLATVLE